MNATERFKNLLSGKPVDRLPVIEWAPYWDKTIDRWHGDGFPRSIRADEQIHDYFGLDKCLRLWIDCKTKATPRPAGHGLGIMTDEEDYEKIIRPTLFPNVKTLVSDEHFEWLHMTRKRGDTVHFFSADGAFWYPRTLFGIENHLFSFYDYPELYKRICDELADWLLELFDFVFSRFRYDFFAFGEDMSYNNGSMISKENFDEFLAPYYKKLIPAIHSYGIPVYIDSDGDITSAVDWYASVGADGMLPLERQAGVDISVYQKKQPQMSFIGHFDKMCMKNGEDAMRKEFERLLPSMKSGKFIPSVDHQTPPDVSVENYKIYVRLLSEYAYKGADIDIKNVIPCPVFSSR